MKTTNLICMAVRGEFVAPKQAASLDFVTFLIVQLIYFCTSGMLIASNLLCKWAYTADILDDTSIPVTVEDGVTDEKDETDGTDDVCLFPNLQVYDVHALHFDKQILHNHHWQLITCCSTHGLHAQLFSFNCGTVGGFVRSFYTGSFGLHRLRGLCCVRQNEFRRGASSLFYVRFHDRLLSKRVGI